MCCKKEGMSRMRHYDFTPSHSDSAAFAAASLCVCTLYPDPNNPDNPTNPYPPNLPYNSNNPMTPITLPLHSERAVIPAP